MASSLKLYAQTESAQDLTQYLFPEFSKSRVKMKTGSDLILILNYNTITGTMVFQRNAQFYDMANPESVDTVYLQNRRLVPFGKVFYEVVVNASVSFFIQHKSDLKESGKPAGYGGTSEVSATSYLSGFDHPSGYYNLKLPPSCEIKYSPVYWVRINNNMLSFYTVRQFLKIFPEQAEQIKQFFRESKLKIENREDLIKLGNFCNELMKEK